MTGAVGLAPRREGAWLCIFEVSLLCPLLAGVQGEGGGWVVGASCRGKEEEISSSLQSLKERCTQRLDSSGV